MESSKTDKNTSGNKNVYYFLNRIISNLKNEISHFWTKSLKIREDSKQIAKKYKISNTHWRVTVKSILNKGPAMTPLEKNMLGVLMKLTKNPKKFMNEKFGRQIVTFRNSSSETSFMEKCQNAVYPWLKNLIFEKLVLSSETVAEFDGLKDKMLLDFFKSDEKTTESNKSMEGESENNAFMGEEAKEHQNNKKISINAIKNDQKPKKEQKNKNIFRMEEDPRNLIKRCEIKEEEKDSLGKASCNCQKQMKEMSDQIKFLSNHVFLLWDSIMGIRREQNDKIISNSNLVIN